MVTPREPKRIEDRGELTRTRRYAESSRNGIERLRMAQSASNHAEAIRIDAVRFARSQGISWAAIAEELGVSKQAAIQRYGRGGRHDVEAMGKVRDAPAG